MMNLLSLSTFIFCALWAFVDPFNITGKGVTESDKVVIMQTHEIARQTMKTGAYPDLEKASYMRKLNYDTKLAEEAQKITDNCEFYHINVQDERFDVGQNLYKKYAPVPLKEGPGWSIAIGAWLREIQYYVHGGPINQDNGHFTQIIWADTEYIGCGYTACDVTNELMPHVYLYACMYGPAGNYVGEDPYELAEWN